MEKQTTENKAENVENILEKNRVENTLMYDGKELSYRVIERTAVVPKKGRSAIRNSLNVRAVTANSAAANFTASDYVDADCTDHGSADASAREGEAISFGELVRNARINKNLSQPKLAKKIGVCLKTINDIEKNNMYPKYDVLYRLVRELNLPLYQIFYPDIPQNFEAKNRLLQEVRECTDYEVEIILAVAKSLKRTIRGEVEPLDLKRPEFW